MMESGKVLTFSNFAVILIAELESNPAKTKIFFLSLEISLLTQKLQKLQIPSNKIMFLYFEIELGNFKRVFWGFTKL